MDISRNAKIIACIRTFGERWFTTVELGKLTGNATNNCSAALTWVGENATLEKRKVKGMRGYEYRVLGELPPHNAHAGILGRKQGKRKSPTPSPAEIVPVVEPATATVVPLHTPQTELALEPQAPPPPVSGFGDIMAQIKDETAGFIRHARATERRFVQILEAYRPAPPLPYVRSSITEFSDDELWDELHARRADRKRKRA